jgi:hypothetical protein
MRYAWRASEERPSGQPERGAASEQRAGAGSQVRRGGRRAGVGGTTTGGQRADRRSAGAEGGAIVQPLLNFF